MHAAWDGDRIVGGAGAFDYAMSVPGGASIPAAGVTVVGVLPTHRRRGALAALMAAQLDDSRARGDVAAYLWASEATIYGRFGYGLASRIGVDRRSRAIARGLPCRSSHAERCAWSASTKRRRSSRRSTSSCVAQRPGMFSRSEAWWRTRRLFDDPARRAGRAAQPRAARARRRAGRLCALPRQAGLGGRFEQGDGHDPRGRHADAGGDARALALAASTSTGRRSSSPTCCRSTIRSSCCSPSRAGCASRSTTASGCACSTSRRPCRRARTRATVRSSGRRRFVPPGERPGATASAAAGAERTEGRADLRLGVAELGSVYLGGFGFARPRARSSRSRSSSRSGRARRCALPNRRRALVRRDLLTL